MARPTDAPGGEAAQHLLPFGALDAAGELPNLDASGVAELRQGAEVLAGEKLGGGHERALRARFDGAEHGQHRDQRLARADIALQQAEHAAGRGHVGADLGERLRLARGEGVAEGGQRLVLQGAGARQRPAGAVALATTHQADRHLARQQLVIGQALARQGGERPQGALEGADRGVEGGPLLARDEGGVGPFGQRAEPFQRGFHRGAQALRRQVADQRPDRLDERQRLGAFGTQGVQHGPAARALRQDAAGEEADGAGGQQLLDPGEPAVHVADGQRPAAGDGLDLDIGAAGGFRARGPERRHLHLEDAILVGGRVLGARHAAADDHALGQVEQKVEHAPAARRFLQQGGERGADALQLRDGGEQPGGSLRVLRGGGETRFPLRHRADRIPMHPYMAGPSAQADMPDDPDTANDLSPRRRRLLFRAWHRGTKETDLMVGGFVKRNIAAFTDGELDELEAVLELPDVDLADWLSGRRAIPAHVTTPMLERMALECGVAGAGVPDDLKR